MQSHQIYRQNQQYTYKKAVLRLFFFCISLTGFYSCLSDNVSNVEKQKPRIKVTSNFVDQIQLDLPLALKNAPNPTSNTINNTVFVPVSCVLVKNKKSFVFIIESSKSDPSQVSAIAPTRSSSPRILIPIINSEILTAKIVPVTTGEINGRYISILKGLNPNDQIIISKHNNLKSGVLVETSQIKLNSISFGNNNYDTVAP